jgi:energy-coupling factor transporter ATP-binding protein EcfA2
MIRKITLENFMSHTKTVIEPADGLTVLTGPNNCGKSAVVVALQALCTNELSSKSYVRHGTREARVSIDTSDGHRVEWIRGKETSYRIDGRDVHRLRGQLPDGLHEALRLPAVVDSKGTEFDIHFAEQKSPIFLLNEPGSRAATFFASSSDARLLMMMLQRQKENIQDWKREERVRLQSQSEARRELDSIGELESLEVSVAEASRKHESLTRSIRQAEDLYRVQDRFQALATRVADLDATCSSLEPLQSPPPQEDTRRIHELCRFIETHASALERFRNVCGALGPLVATPALHETEGLRRLAARLELSSAAYASLSALHDCCSGLQAPPEVIDTHQLTRLLASASQAERRCRLLAAKLKIAESLPEPPLLADTAGLRSEIEKISARETLLRSQGYRR